MGRRPIRTMGGTQVVPIVNPCAWQKKPFAYRVYPRTGHNPTPPMLAAQISLSEAAHSAFGARGFVGDLPVVAAKVRAACSGKDFGGRSREEIARERHEIAGHHISAMKRALQKA